ncbi:MAG: hypothetical protein LBH01_07945 [Verrucomicrobiales bacterium]|jgi:hypothetical protein|nr:hypothetical protein [Verrucomicrobiales bacterium]
MMKSLIYSLVATLVLSVQSYAVTAFQAVEIARKQVNDYAKKSLVQVVGKPSTVGQMPEEWQVLFYDPKAEQNGMMITVSGNVVTGIHDGYTQMDNARILAYKMEEIIDPNKFKIDSTRVIPILQNDSSLKDVKITSIGLWLKKDKKGPLEPPVWHADLYASNAKGDKEVQFGTAKVDAETGKIVKLDLNLKAIGKGK